MRIRLVLITAVLVGAGVLLIRSHVERDADPLSGVWTGDWGTTPSHRNPVTVDLKWDGKEVTGIVNAGPHASRLTKAIFDIRTGAIHLEFDIRSAGREIHYTVDGVVEDKVLIGNWSNDTNRGGLRLKRE